MSAVVAREDANRMSATAVTAVMAPVLMRGATISEKEESAADPLTALAAAQRHVKLAAALLASHESAQEEQRAAHAEAGPRL